MLYQKERNHGCRISDAWSYQGLKTCILENEIIRVMVLVDKGADIYQFVHKPTDTDFLWKSPWGVRNPSKFLPTSGDPTSNWIDVYEGGWQTVMPAGGFPSKVNGADLGLHAEANLLPWDNTIIKDTEEEVSVKFSPLGTVEPVNENPRTTLPLACTVNPAAAASPPPAPVTQPSWLN